MFIYITLKKYSTLYHTTENFILIDNYWKLLKSSWMIIHATSL